jgi:hypothetical protein
MRPGAASSTTAVRRRDRQASWPKLHTLGHELRPRLSERDEIEEPVGDKHRSDGGSISKMPPDRCSFQGQCQHRLPRAAGGDLQHSAGAPVYLDRDTHHVRSQRLRITSRPCSLDSDRALLDDPELRAYVETYARDDARFL